MLSLDHSTVHWSKDLQYIKLRSITMGVVVSDMPFVAQFRRADAYEICAG